MYFLGVDIGNTKSHALIADQSGQIIGFGQAGRGNYEVIGVEGFKNILTQITLDALASAGIQRDQVSGMGFGIAGYDWPSDDPIMSSVIDSMGINAPYGFVNDAMIGLIAGAKTGWGVSVSSGTSCNCYGRDAQGRQGRITGNGPTFGEYGGGSEIVYASVQAISRAWSLRGPETLLTDLFVKHLGATDATDLLEGMARGRYALRATDALIVFEAIAQGDKVANDLLVWIAEELGNLAIGVIRQLKLEKQTFEVVMAGSFYKGSPVIAQIMERVIKPVAPGAQLTRLEAAPVVGGVMLGMERAGVDFTVLRERLLESTTQVIRERDGA